MLPHLASRLFGTPLLEMLATSMGRYGAGAAPRSDSGNTRVRK